MEHGTLGALLATEAPRLLAPARSIEILRAVSDALFPLHAAGRTYGAFGPDSVLLEGDAVSLSEEPLPDDSSIAPELRDGGEPTPASDAFAFAALAHRVLAGLPPAFADDGTPVPVVDLHPGFPTFAGDAIARSLRPAPAERPLPKVLFTLLSVVPADRWPDHAPGARAEQPAAAEQPIAAEQPAASEQALPADPATSEPVDTDEAAVTEPQQPQQTIEPAIAEPQSREEQRAEFLRRFSPVHAVPTIEWDHRQIDEPHPVPAIDWRSDGDPTRASYDVPRILWDPSGDEPAEVEEPRNDDLTAAAPEPEPHDVAEPDDHLAGDLIDGTEVPSHGVPVIEPLAEAIPAEQLEHRPGRRSRRKHRPRRSNGARLQKAALVLIVLVLLAFGLAYGLSHKNDPPYDGTTQGASRSLSQPSWVRE